MAEPKHVDAVRQCLADGVLRSARDIGLALDLDRSAVYSALNWLQASGEAAPQGGWPRRWGTTTTSLAEQVSDDRERCDVASAWLASRQWSVVAHVVHKRTYCVCIGCMPVAAQVRTYCPVMLVRTWGQIHPVPHFERRCTPGGPGQGHLDTLPLVTIAGLGHKAKVACLDVKKCVEHSPT